MKKIIIVLLSVVALSGCENVGGSLIVHSRSDGFHNDAPPPHAPAYGLRNHERMYRYYYYPDAYVYFSPVQNMYFYLSSNEWRMTAVLPRNIRIQLGEHVDIESAYEKPYHDYDKHKKMYKGKKHNKERGYEKNGKRKKHNKRDDD
jgi:hypothetical protein